MSDDFSAVKVTLDKDTYNQGDLMTATLSGSAVLTQQTTENESITFHTRAADGSSSDVIATIQVTKTTATPESTVLVGVSDPSGRNWEISPTGLTATATA